MAHKNHFATWPVVVYGLNLLLCALAYTFLTKAVLGHHENSHIATAIGSDWKGKISLFCYVVALALAFYFPWAAGALFVAVALMWFIPDRRMEKMFS